MKIKFETLIYEEKGKVAIIKRVNSPVHPLQKSRYILYTLVGRRQTPVIVPVRSSILPIKVL